MEMIKCMASNPDGKYDNAVPRKLTEYWNKGHSPKHSLPSYLQSAY